MVLNQGFKTEYFDFIEVLGLNFWYFSHHPQNKPDFTIGNTQLITSQLDNLNFGENMCISTRSAYS